MSEPGWKAYERQIFERLKDGVAADAEVSFDEGGRQRLPGRLSGIDRQIDVIVRGRFAGLPGEHTMVVDCKLINRRLDVTHVEAFAGLLEDTGMTLGLLVTAEGFSKAAKRRAAAVRGLELDVVRLDLLDKWLPRRPAIGVTAGASTATLTYIDDQGCPRTDIVPLPVGKRVIAAYRAASA